MRNTFILLILFDPTADARAHVCMAYPLEVCSLRQWPSGFFYFILLYYLLLYNGGGNCNNDDKDDDDNDSMIAAAKRFNFHSSAPLMARFGFDSHSHITQTTKLTYNY